MDFFGVTFSQPIASLFYDDGGGSLPGSHEEMLDSVTFGTAVPEPSSWLLAALGLLIVTAAAWRGCPTCWAIGLVQTRARASCPGGCRCDVASR